MTTGIPPATSPRRSRTSSTRPPSGSSSSTTSAPARSRSPANRRTLTCMVRRLVAGPGQPATPLRATGPLVRDHRGRVHVLHVLVDLFDRQAPVDGDEVDD